MHPHATGVEKAAAPYGSWESPISAAAVSAAGKAVEGLAVAGDGRLLWVETRPEEGGYAKNNPPTPSRCLQTLAPIVAEVSLPSSPGALFS
jgi:hypothetical protein